MSRRAIAGVLLLLLARGAVLSVAAMLLIPAGAGIYLNVVIVGVDIATIAVTGRLIRKSHGSVRRFVGRFVARRDIPLAGVTMFVLFVSLSLGTLVGNALVFAGPPPASPSDVQVPLWLGLWSLLVMPVTVALAEELLYRGWAPERLTNAWRPWVAVVICAVAFGLQHAPLSATSPGEAVVRVIATGLAGLALGIMRARGVTLSALILGHWAFDVIGLGLPALSSSLS
jgi:membrane protease YdiL (CAAX protease family)